MNPATQREELLLGIDFGTGGCKLSLITPRGEVVASFSKEYPTQHPRAGWAEQDAADWYPAMVECLKMVWTKTAITPDRIAALAIDGSTHNAVLLDGAMKPLRRVIMWTDQRSAPESEWLGANHGEQIFRLTHHRATPTWTLPQLRWLHEHEREILPATRHVLFVKDYVRYLLTEELCTDHVDAQGTLLYDVTRGRWSEELCELAGLKITTLPAIVKPSAVAGRVTARAAKETGLLEGTPVICGSSDTALEAYAAGAVEAGQCIVKLATAGNVNVMTDAPRPHAQTLTYSQVVPGMWYTATATNSAAVSMRWFRDRFCASELDAAARAGGSAYSLMGEAAAKSPIGARGLFFHPYLQGERSPYWDPQLRASFTGITAQHERGDFIRAVMEGVAFSLRDCRRVIDQLNLPVREIRLIGGGAKDPLWAQIVCDVMNVPLTLPAFSDASCGAAMLAGVGVGIFRDERDAVKKCAHNVSQLTPAAAAAESYERLFARYRRIHDVLAEVYHEPIL